MLYLGADHRGFQLKEELKKWLQKKGIEFVDLGNKVLDPFDDDVDFARLVAEKVLESQNNRGVVICGSGTGMCVAANKVKGIRCAVAISRKLVQQDRKHDDNNMLSLPAQALSINQARKMVEAFLDTPFSGLEKYQRRLQKLESYF